MNDDMDYIEYGQWVWRAINEFDRIELKINNHQSEIKVAELGLEGYPDFLVVFFEGVPDLQSAY